DVGLRGRLGHAEHAQPRALRLADGGRVLAQPDHHVDAGGFEVQGVRMALTRVAQDPDLLAVEPAEVRVLVVEDLECHGSSRDPRMADYALRANPPYKRFLVSFARLRE